MVTTFAQADEDKEHADLNVTSYGRSTTSDSFRYSTCQYSPFKSLLWEIESIKSGDTIKKTPFLKSKLAK